MARIAIVLLLSLFALSGAAPAGGFEVRPDAKAAGEQESSASSDPETSLRSRTSRAPRWREMKESISVAAAGIAGEGGESAGFGSSRVPSRLTAAPPRALYALQRSLRL